MPFIFLSTISTNGSRALSVCVCWMLLLQPNDCLEKKGRHSVYVRKSVDQMFTNWIEVMRAQPTSSKQQTKDDENTQTKPKVAELFMKLSVIFDSEYIYTFCFSLFWVIVVWGWNLIPISARVLCPTQCCSRKIIRPKKLVGFWQVPRRHIFIVSLRCTCCQSQLCMQY